MQILPAPRGQRQIVAFHLGQVTCGLVQLDAIGGVLFHDQEFALMFNNGRYCNAGFPDF